MGVVVVSFSVFSGDSEEVCVVVVVAYVVVVVVSVVLELSGADEDSVTDDASELLSVFSEQAAIDRIIVSASAAAMSFFI